MKAYTDLEQSKKLAEILPIESADMWWLYVTAQGKHIAMMYEEADPHYLARMESYGIKNAAIRCWSLEALFNILPEINGIPLKVEKVKAKDGYDGYYYHIEYEGIVLIPYSKNPVDACYEMIIKLHELKML